MATPTISQLPAKLKVVLYRGDDLTVPLRWWTDDTKTTLRDLTGWSVELKMRGADGTLLDTLSTTGGEIVVNDGSDPTGNIIITFPNGKTSGYTWDLAAYDLQLTDPTGKIRTLIAGTVSVKADV